MVLTGIPWSRWSTRSSDGVGRSAFGLLASGLLDINEFASDMGHAADSTLPDSGRYVANP
jgi:hypothetical protein